MSEIVVNNHISEQRWVVLKLETTHEGSELLTDYLSSIGAEGVAVRDRVEFEELIQGRETLDYASDEYLQTLGDTVQIEAFFPVAEQVAGTGAETELFVFAEPIPGFEIYETATRVNKNISELSREIMAFIRNASEWLDLGQIELNFSEVASEDWAENWKRYYETIHIGKRLVINPSWIPYEAKAGEVVLTLDPGSAFGTGTHESTGLCLEMLENLAGEDSRKFASLNMLDLGCGSGILALAAAKLGAISIKAIDIDPRAVTVARENAAINGIEMQIETAELSAEAAASFDLILANLIARLHLDLSAQYATHLKRGGLIIMSGIVADRAEEVKAKLFADGFSLLREDCRNEWVVLLMRYDG